jgi:hypothetical protein
MSESVKRDDTKLDWFGVRTLHLWTERHAYEERVTLWRADSFVTAIALAEADAREYMPDYTEYLGLAQAYDTKVDDFSIEPSFEAFSMVRESDLSPSDYVDTFFDTGREYGGSLD